MAAVERARQPVTVPPTGLLLSIGDKTVSQSGKEIPTRIDHFRPKEGQLAQYLDEAARFVQVYGDQPRQLDDVMFLSNHVGDVLDIRLMAWGASGVRLRGDTNYATLPRDEWEQRAFAFDDSLVFYPLNADEVPKTRRDEWQGEPLLDRLKGPDDPRIGKYEINVEATLTFLLPRVMGVGKVAKITTKSRRSMRNLHTSLLDLHDFFRGNLIGPPFRLAVRRARTRRFDREKRAYVPTDFYELVLDTPLTVADVIDIVREHREALGGGLQQLAAAEAREFTRAMALPVAGETVQLRDEPEAEPDRPDDALLNRIAALETEVGAGASTTLKGVFGVDAATELSQADAERYEQILVRSLEAEPVDGEVVE